MKKTVGLCFLVILLGVRVAWGQATPVPTTIPTPLTCAPTSPLRHSAVQLADRPCRPQVHGPTVGTCVIGVVDHVLVLDCPGQSLQKFTTTDWP